MKNIVVLCVQARIPSKTLYFLQQYLIFFSIPMPFIFLKKLWLPLISRCDMLGLKNVCFHDKNIQSYRVLSSYMQSFRFNSQYHTYRDYINHNFLNHSIPRRAGEGINSGSPRISISSELPRPSSQHKGGLPQRDKGKGINDKDRS